MPTVKTLLNLTAHYDCFGNWLLFQTHDK